MKLRPYVTGTTQWKVCSLWYCLGRPRQSQKERSLLSTSPVSPRRFLLSREHVVGTDAGSSGSNWCETLPVVIFDQSVRGLAGPAAWCQQLISWLQSYGRHALRRQLHSIKQSVKWNHLQHTTISTTWLTDKRYTRNSARLRDQRGSLYFSYAFRCKFLQPVWYPCPSSFAYFQLKIFLYSLLLIFLTSVNSMCDTREYSSPSSGNPSE